MYEKVLIATDGSRTAGHAARVGAELVRKVGAEGILLFVGDPAEGRGIIEDANQSLGGGFKTVVETGDPADRIIDVAEREGVDLIVVGNKGMTGAQRFLLGSVPNRVSHHAPCNVLIVKTT